MKIKSLLIMMLALLQTAASGQQQEAVSVRDYIAASQKAMQAERVNVALEQAEQAVKLDPAAADAWRQLGAVQMKRGDYTNAITAFRNGLDLNPSSETPLREIARCRHLLGERKAAIDAMTRYVEGGGSQDASALRDLARWHGKAKDYSRAIDTMKQALNRDPLSAQAWRDLGTWLWREEGLEAALDAFEQALDVDPGLRGELAVDMAAQLSELNKTERAAGLIKKWLPDQSLFAVGKALLEAERIKAAQGLLKEAWKEPGAVPEVGLYLAYAQAQNSHCEQTADACGPFVKNNLEQAGQDAWSMLMRVVSVCGREAAMMPLLLEIEENLDRTPVNPGKVLDLLEKNAEALQSGPRKRDAWTLYLRILHRDPDRLCWYRAFELSRTIEGDAGGGRLLENLLKRAKKPAIRHGLLGKKADLSGRAKDAFEQYKKSLAAAPEQPRLRQALFQQSQILGRTDEIQDQLTWFRQKVEAGQTELRSFLAEMLTAAGHHEQAREAWELLHLASPGVPYYAIEAARLHLAACQADIARELILETLDYGNDPRLFEMLADIEWTLGNPAAGAEAAARGLEHHPSPFLHRAYAEQAESAGLLTTSTWEAASNALAAARAYVAEDPGYTPMSLLLGRVFEGLHLTNQGTAYYTELLKSNPDHVPALSYLQHTATRRKDSKAMIHFAERLLKERPEDPHAQRRFAMSLGEQHRFRKGLNRLRRLAKFEEDTAVPAFLYRNVTACDYPGRVSIAQVENHLRYLKNQGYRFADLKDLAANTVSNRRALLLFTDLDQHVFEAVDRLLVDLENGPAVYAGHLGMLTRNIPGKASPKAVRQAKEAGHWRPAANGPENLKRVPVAPGPMIGNPFTHRLSNDGRTESMGAFTERLETALGTWARALPRHELKLLVYPWNTYGHNERGTGRKEKTKLRDAVGRHFDFGAYADPSGFITPDCDPLRLPVRVVPPRWNVADLEEHLQKEHPLLRAQVDLAKMLYWNRQYEMANKAFSHLDKKGVFPHDVSYNWGASAFREGDMSTALRQLERARMLSPENEKVAQTLGDVKRQIGPVFALRGHNWEDNEDRYYTTRGLGAQTYVHPRLSLGAGLEKESWRKRGVQDQDGHRVSLPFKGHLDQDVWLRGSVWFLDLDDAPDQTGGRLQLRMPSAFLHGYYQLHYRRMEVDTLEALVADIRTDHFRLNTYSRIRDEWDLFLKAYVDDRTDGNQTHGISLTLAYRITESPFLSVGYRGLYADSDRDPPAYWAPEGLQEHLAYLTFRGTYRQLYFNTSFEAGYGKEEDIDWDFMWGSRGEISLTLSDRLTTGFEYKLYEGIDYTRQTYGGSVSLRF